MFLFKLPEKITCSAMTTSPQSNLQIGAQKEFTLLPTPGRNMMVKLKEACRKVDVKLPANINFLHLIITNLVKEPITLIWNTTLKTGQWMIKSNEVNRSVYLTFGVRTTATFAAMSTKGSILFSTQ